MPTLVETLSATFLHQLKLPRQDVNMMQALPKTPLVTFAEFIQWKPDGVSYEFHDGEIIEMNHIMSG
jgi:hypothetical protein